MGAYRGLCLLVSFQDYANYQRFLGEDLHGGGDAEDEPSWMVSDYLRRGSLFLPLYYIVSIFQIVTLAVFLVDRRSRCRKDDCFPLPPRRAFAVRGLECFVNLWAMPEPKTTIM